MRMLIASEHDAYFWSAIVPADGATAATVGNGNFGMSPFFGQLGASCYLTVNVCRVSRIKRKDEVEKLGAEYLLVDWACSLGELSPRGARAIAYHLAPKQCGFRTWPDSE
jgi:hypothetical protein